MAALVCVMLMLAMIGVSDGAWCVCRPDVSKTALQKTLDYACGAGADCTAILQGGACYNPNNVRAHCSYAANSYYQRKGQNQQDCDFSGTAILTSSDPSSNVLEVLGILFVSNEIQSFMLTTLYLSYVLLLALL